MESKVNLAYRREFQAGQGPMVYDPAAKEQK